MLYEAFIQTSPLWAILAVLGLAVAAEDFYKYMQRRADRQQILIDLEVDRLHR